MIENINFTIVHFFLEMARYFKVAICKKNLKNSTEF